MYTYPSQYQPVRQVSLLTLLVQIGCFLIYLLSVYGVIYTLLQKGPLDVNTMVVAYFGVKSIIATDLLQCTCSGNKEDGCTAALFQSTVFADLMLSLIFVLAALDDRDPNWITLVVFKVADLAVYTFVVCAWTKDARCSICPWATRREVVYMTPIGMPQEKYVLVPMSMQVQN